ncbi:hypothetical protein VKT23_013822 [Stygiomarasmius scandens]|uniref:Uncharacterized protein n=1 Tax=Marasmiellus scandens TaxID=2682957 RepID=A0ABR1J6M5_9AGAR
MQLTPLFISIATLSLAPIEVFGDVGVHCGTTDDATFSDCQALVNPDTWNAAFTTGNICHWGLGNPANNVACHGNCCVYVARLDNLNSEQIRNEAAGLFGCADTGANKINGMQEFQDTHGTCISNGDVQSKKAVVTALTIRISTR